MFSQLYTFLPYIILGALKLQNSSEISGLGLFYIKNFQSSDWSDIFHLLLLLLLHLPPGPRDIVRNLVHTDIWDILFAQIRRYYIHFYASLIREPYPLRYTYNRARRLLRLDIIILKHKQCRRVILPKKRAITTNGMIFSVYGC